MDPDLRRELSQPELRREVKLWGLREPAVTAELLAIASGAKAMGQEQTPQLYVLERDWLFVGFAHNLLLESMVSRLAMIEKQHPRCSALTLDYTASTTI